MSKSIEAEHPLVLENMGVGELSAELQETERKLSLAMAESMPEDEIERLNSRKEKIEELLSAIKKGTENIT